MSDISGNPVYDTALAYQRTAALIAAVKLDIFTLIGEGDMTSDVLAQVTGTSPRGMRILCDFLTTIGLLRKQNSTYHLVASSKLYLDRSSSNFIGSCLDFFAAPEMLALAFEDPLSYIQRGGSRSLASLKPEHPIWCRFAIAMAPIAAQVAKRVVPFIRGLPEPPDTVLDIAAGHGLYGIEILRHFPCASVTVIDWSPVLTVARKNAEQAGVAHRMQFIAGSALEVEWTTGFDIVLLANFLHHFGRDECVQILRKAKASLSNRGQVLAVEFVPNSDRVSPPLPAMFAFSMLMMTPTGDAYTVEDFESMARQAGYAGLIARHLAPTPQTLLIFKT